MKRGKKHINWRCQDAKCNSGKLFIQSDLTDDGMEFNFKICKDDDDNTISI